MPLATGSRLGPYEVRGALGAGGMGEVYRAHDSRLGRDVALKILPSDVSSDSTRLERFTREARTIAALNHPHIVTIYSTEEIDGVRFFTMELVEGQTLDALIGPDGLLLTRFFEVALPLADALTAAHQKGITHRDLKPGNVIVSADGRVKVLDFGLAKASTPLEDQAFRPGHEIGRFGASPPRLDLDMTAPPMTSPGMIVGTMPYMSPEQIEGRAVDHRSDLFSLGVMFHEMLTGSRPFGGESSPQLMSSILRDAPSNISDARADIPEALSRLIARCLEKRPNDRVQTARDIYNELRHLQKQIESGSARRSSVHSAMSGTFWIAVLPFTSAGEASVQALADGLTEDITAGLSRFSSLSVLAHQSVREAAARGADSQRVAERLSARYVIAGSVRQSGASLRVGAHLVDASSGTQLWSEIYQRDTSSSDVFAIQDDVTDRIVATVADRSGVLVRSMVQTLQHLSADQLSVRDLVLRCHLFHQLLTPDQHAAFRSALEHALAADARHPEAWGALATLYFAEYAFSLNPQPEPLARARRAAERALDLDASTQNGWEALASIAFFERDEDGLVTAADQAISLNPRNSNTLAWMGMLLLQSGAEEDRGIALIERAMAINPHHPGWYHYGPFKRQFKRGEYAEALRSARRVNMPDFPDAHWAIAAAAGHLGRQSEARSAIDAIRRLAPQLLNRDALHAFTARWHWQEDLVERFVEGFERAQALADAASATRGVHAAERAMHENLGAGVSFSPGRPAKAAERPASDQSTAPRHELSVAVLPFAARSSDEESTALAEGLTDDITAGLAKFAWLSVVSRASAERMKGKAADIKTIGAELNARYVIEGTVRKAGGTVRVSARLEDVDSGAHVWAENYDRDLASGTFAVQDDLTSRIVATVADANGVLMRTRSAALVNKPLEQLTVSELCDRVHWYAEHLRADVHAQFRAAFELAVQREPTSARAWALLAVFYSHEVLVRLNPLPDAAGRTRHAAERAMDLAANAQQTWVAHALASFLAHDLTALRLATERTVALNPLNTRSVATSGLLLAFTGDCQAGADLVRRAVALNPNHPGWYHSVLFFDHFRKSEDESALQQAKAINIPGFVWSHLSSVAAAGQLGRAADAIPALEGLRRNFPDLLDRDRVRAAWASVLWDDGLVARLIEGFDKAVALQADVKKPASEAGRRASVAVLPFTDLSAAKDQEWFCDGIAEEILNALTQLPGLRVAARTSAFSFRGKENELRDIADKLKVSTVLQGSVRRAGDRVRITVQLVDATSGFQLWSERYDREVKDIFDVQDEIARAAAGRLRVTLSGDADKRLVARHSANVEAYELYVKGRGLLYQRGSSVKPALEKFQQAVALDPDYALAWAGIGDAYVVMAYFGVVRRDEARQYGLSAARRALQLDPECAEAHTSLAALTLLVECDRPAAERAFLRALELNPHYIQARCWYALFYLQWTAGRLTEGVDEARKALSVDPMSAYVWMVVGVCEGTAGRDEPCIAAGRHAIALDPQSYVGTWALGVGLCDAGRYAEALEVLDRAAAMSNHHHFALGTMALTYMRDGQPERAKAVREELEQRSKTQYIPCTQLMLAAEATGDRDAAMRYAERAWRDREPPFILLARHFPDVRSLHSDPRFLAILAEMDA
jgi:TolB-like protein/Tfp pilus assembly protein PilF